jgi:hypothetical protein
MQRGTLGGGVHFDFGSPSNSAWPETACEVSKLELHQTQVKTAMIFMTRPPPWPNWTKSAIPFRTEQLARAVNFVMERCWPASRRYQG